VRFHPPAALHLAEAQRAIVADWRTSYQRVDRPEGVRTATKLRGMKMATKLIVLICAGMLHFGSRTTGDPYESPEHVENLPCQSTNPGKAA
jgi:hypothetical protein